MTNHSIMALVACAWLLSCPSYLAAQEYKRIRRIEFAGTTYFSASMLRDSLKMTRVNALVVPGMVEADVQMNLKRLLKEHGFLQSNVEWTLIPLEPRDAALHMQITEGPQYRLARLEILGVTAFSPEDVLSKFELHIGDVVNFTALKNDLEQIKAMYVDEGFVDWSYIPRQDFDPERKAVTMRFQFEEGTQYRIAYVGFTGCNDQPEEDRIRLRVNIRPGEIYSETRHRAACAILKEFGLTNDTVEVVDQKRGLLGVVFWLKRPQ